MLSGALPFDGFSQWDLISNISEGHYELPETMQSDPLGSDLLRESMMSVDASKRGTLLQIQKHKWFQTHGDSAALERKAKDSLKVVFNVAAMRPVHGFLRSIENYETVVDGAAALEEGDGQQEATRHAPVSTSAVMVYDTTSSTPVQQQQQQQQPVTAHATQQHNTNTVLLSSQDLKPVDYNTLSSPSSSASSTATTAKSIRSAKKKSKPCCSIA
jgi:hypothetical protein